MSELNRIAVGLVLGWAGCWLCLGGIAPGAGEIAEVRSYESVREAPAHFLTFAPSDAPADAPSPFVDPPVEVARFVHTLALNDHAQIGSCVSIGAGTYVTARHIFEDAHGDYLSLTRVMIADQIVNARVEHLESEDLSLIRTDGNLAGAALAKEPPAVHQRVLLYGMTTAAVQHGRVTEVGADVLRVDVDATETGVTQGDSGGGVFTEDGKLLGVISAFYGSRKSGTADQRRVYVAPVNDVAARLSKPGPAAAAAAGAKRPRISIISPATWDCPSCPEHRDQDWSDFDVKFEQRDGLPAYPSTEWTDSRGIVRRLYGKYTPAQVRWSWERTR